MSRAGCRDAGDGHTIVELTVRPGLDRVRVSLLDLHRDGPSPTIEGLVPIFAEATKLLKDTAFVSNGPRSFAANKARAEADALLARLKDKGEFESRVADLCQRFGRETAALAGGGLRAWIAQHRTSAYVARHSDLLWELRFAVLEQ